MNEKKARALIERHFTDPLPAAQFKQLWAHVTSCAGCKAHYDRLFAFEARLDGGKSEVERIGASLFAELEPPKQGLFELFGLTWTLPRTAMAAAGLAALLAVVVVGPQLRRDDFAERGGVAFGPELLATCFRDVGGKLEGVQALEPAGKAPACPRGGRLAFAYRNARDGDRLAIFAQRATEVSPLVAPSDLERGSEKRPLAGSFAIDADAPEGEVKLVAVFGKSLDTVRLQQALKSNQDLQVAAGKDAVVRTLAYRLEKP